MTPRRRRAKYIYGGDLHTFALIMALAIFVPFSVVMTSPAASPQGNWGQLPRIHHARVLGAWGWGANRDDAIIVTVARDGCIFFGADRITTGQLPSRIRQRVSSGSERRVYLRADAVARYEYVKPVLEAVRSVGVTDIAIFANE